ncbi:MAG: hypothetical protein AAGI17_03595 [Planctomycetota bacterium]
MSAADGVTTSGPELPDVQQNLVKPTEPGIGRVVSTRICTASRKAAGFVRHVEIDVSETALAGAFCAGQSFGVLAPGEDDKGRPHKLRLYSIASPTAGEDGEGKVLATTVKRLIDEHWDDHTLYTGVASNYLCDLKEGDEVRVTGPSGKRFLLPARPEEHDYVFFATGTGIAPFRGMLGDLIAAGVDSRSILVMGAPYASDLLYHDEMVQRAGAGTGFAYLPTLSRQDQPDGGGSMYVQGRIATDPGLQEVLASDRTLIYVCGIAGMELGIFRALHESLDPDVAQQYLTVAEDAPEPEAWTRRMIHRQIKPTRRVFLEVY